VSAAFARHLLLGLGLFLAAAGMTACGSKSEPMGDDEAAQSVVLGVSQLPSGSKPSKKPLVSERCSPVSYFRDYAKAVVASPGFILPEGELLQQVGIFKNEGDARRAFDAVTAKAAWRCVGREAQRVAKEFTGREGELALKRVSRKLPNVEARGLNMRLVLRLGSVEVERTAILDGRVLTTVTLISQNQPLNPSYSPSISRAAARSLTETLASIEL